MNKPLSMTPSAIKKREARAAAKSTVVLYLGGVNITAKREHDANFVGPIVPEASQVAAEAVVVAPEKPQEVQNPSPVVRPTPAPGSDMSVLVVGHAFVKGKGNDKPKKDSLWGVLQDRDVFVKFFGRRNGALRFKIADSKDEAMKLYKLKLEGKDAKRLVHVDLPRCQQAEVLGADWPACLFAKYKGAKTNEAVDERSTRVTPPTTPAS